MAICEKLKHENLKQGGRIALSSHVPTGVKFDYPVDIADNVTIYSTVNIGKYSYVNVGSVIYHGVFIGSYCSIARNCEIGVAKHPVDWLSSHPFQFDKGKYKNNSKYNLVNKYDWLSHDKTIIGSDVWIGAKAIIQCGVKIGNGVIIGGGAVVTKDIPDYAIVGGVPAKIIRYRFSEEIRNKLIELKWWELDLDFLTNMNFTDINDCIIKIQNIRNLNEN